MLTQQQTGEFKRTLQQRFLEVREDIRQALLRADEESFTDLAGQVGDLEDASLADLLVDTALADVDRHVEQIRNIDAALMRLASGSYGLCRDCGETIELERLRAMPTAERCRPCQTKFEERGHEQYRNTSL